MKHPVYPWLVPLLASGVAQAMPQGDAGSVSPELEAKFAQQMSGCRMVGRFTVTGSDRAPREESYTIAKVTKLRDDQWRFDAKIEYGDRSVTLPLVVPVRWAGDTPMIQVTDLMVPTLGTYTARVLIYRDRYAGTWSGGDHGGHMYGRIVRDEPDGSDRDAWTSWRGPAGTGVAPAGNPPTEWSEEKNIRWKVAIPGLGSSSPIVWNDRIYVTTAVETDQEGEPPKLEPLPPRGGERGQGGGRGARGARGQRGGGGGRAGRGGRRGGGFGGGRPAPNKVHEFVVLALDRSSGEVVWSRTVAEAVPHEAGQPSASQASSSPLTDGERIYAFFGSRGLHCLDLDGELLWSKDFGYMRTRLGFGEGSSPALHGDTIVVNWDHEGDSFVAALNKHTGEELWRVPRDEGTSWSTPLIVEVSGRAQVIITATGASRSYDLETGELLWSYGGMTNNAIPSPAYAEGIAYLMSGYRGASLQAIRLAGASGDLAEGGHVEWSHGRDTSYVPSALVYDDYIYFVRGNNGVLSCLDRKTGEVCYEGQRLGLRTIYSSPVGAAGRVYVTSREGLTKVLKAGPKLEELATNELDDGFDASAAIVGDELYLRGRAHLYCIAEK